MLKITINKGKKRALEPVEDHEEESSLSELSPPPQPAAKKPKKAETRMCPVCDELIPIRLLAAHADLELERVEMIMKGIGSDETLGDQGEGSSTGYLSRRSALKARKSLTSRPSTSALDTHAQTVKTLHAIVKHRRKRHAKLREMAKEDDGASDRSYTASRGETICPVCLAVLSGDQDVVEAHVDSCVTHASRQLEEREIEERERRAELDVDPWEEVNVDGEVRVRVTDGASFRGTGFDTRDRNQRDVDDEIDVDGDDEAVFGGVQFTEGDILALTGDGQSPEEEVQVDGDTDDEGGEDRKTLRELVAEGKVLTRASSTDGAGDTSARAAEVLGVGEADKLDSAIVTTRRKGDKSALVVALEKKIKQLESMRVSSSSALLCRICLDPYTEPTVSTGCWHTCCRECWLRCLGSTKLCPMCKRITAATELRRVYL